MLARHGAEMLGAVAIWGKSVLRLLMLSILTFALSRSVPTTGLWRMALSGLAALMLAGMLARPSRFECAFRFSRICCDYVSARLVGCTGPIWPVVQT